MGAAKKVIIVKVGVEGGSLTLWGRKQAGRWSFATQSSWSLDDDGDAVAPRSKRLQWVSSWSDALAALDAHPWAQFYAVEVHAEFRAQVRQAVEARLAAGRDTWGDDSRGRWNECLGS